MCANPEDVRLKNKRWILRFIKKSLLWRQGWGAILMQQWNLLILVAYKFPTISIQFTNFWFLLKQNVGVNHSAHLCYKGQYFSRRKSSFGNQERETTVLNSGYQERNKWSKHGVMVDMEVSQSCKEFLVDSLLLFLHVVSFSSKRISNMMWPFSFITSFYLFF